jgi:hypothetical protein
MHSPHIPYRESKAERPTRGRSGVERAREGEGRDAPLFAARAYTLSEAHRLFAPEDERPERLTAFRR